MSSVQFTYLKYDLYRYFYPNNDRNSCNILKKIDTIIFTQGIWAITVYRFRRWATYECENKLIKIPCKLIGALMHLIIEVLTGIHIRPDIDIGPGFYIGHFGCIFLGGNTKIGKFFNISQECTIGYAGRGEKRGLPELGDYVHMAAGAKILGKIKVEDHAAIGANAVVTKDVPKNAVVAGVPARIISYNSSKDFIEYNANKNQPIL